jgi:cytoskeletal protein CcmA (bactofilin family)
MWKPALLTSLPQRPQLFRAAVSEPRTSGSRAAADAASAAARTNATHFPDGLLVNGDLHCEEDVVIDGIVTGTIDMPANALTIGPKAQVDAKVFARDITVYGVVSGKVTATEIVDIRDTARVSGELAAPSVKLAEGARVNARVETKRVDAAVHVARYRMARNAR